MQEVGGINIPFIHFILIIIAPVHAHARLTSWSLLSLLKSLLFLFLRLISLKYIFASLAPAWNPQVSLSLPEPAWMPVSQLVSERFPIESSNSLTYRLANRKKNAKLRTNQLDFNKTNDSPAKSATYSLPRSLTLPSILPFIQSSLAARTSFKS